MTFKLVVISGFVVSWGLWAFFSKLAADKLDVKSAFFWGSVPGFLMMLYMAFAGAELTPKSSTKEFNGMIYGIAGGVCGAIGYALFLKSYQLIPAYIALILSILYPLVTVTLFIIFLHEKINMMQIAGMILCLAGISLLFVTNK